MFKALVLAIGLQQTLLQRMLFASGLGDPQQPVRQQ
jgi:hypothetical protein